MKRKGNWATGGQCGNEDLGVDEPQEGEMTEGGKKGWDTA